MPNVVSSIGKIIKKISEKEEHTEKNFLIMLWEIAIDHKAVKIIVPMTISNSYLKNY